MSDWSNANAVENALAEEYDPPTPYPKGVPVAAIHACIDAKHDVGTRHEDGVLASATCHTCGTVYSAEGRVRSGTPAPPAWLTACPQKRPADLADCTLAAGHVSPHAFAAPAGGDALSGPVGDTQPDEFNDAPVITSFRDLAIYDAYGVSATPVGEEGQWIALGHVEPLRMIAAMRAIGREEMHWGDEETFGYRGPEDGPLTRAVVHRRALFTENDECGWWAHWSTEAQAHPAAVDVTVFEA